MLMMLKPAKRNDISNKTSNRKKNTQSQTPPQKSYPIKVVMNTLLPGQFFQVHNFT